MIVTKIIDLKTKGNADTIDITPDIEKKLNEAGRMITVMPMSGLHSLASPWLSPLAMANQR